MSESSQLSKLLSDLKEKYLGDVREANGKASEWTVVMGNEAGGMFPSVYSRRLLISDHVIHLPQISILSLLRSHIRGSRR